MLAQFARYWGMKFDAPAGTAAAPPPGEDAAGDILDMLSGDRDG